MRNLISFFSRILSQIRTRATLLGRRLSQTIDRRPLGSFFGLLGILLLLIIVGNILRQPPKTEEAEAVTPKQVEIYGIGKAPKIALNAKIEKSGVIALNAQSPGFVQTILKFEGEQVYKGTQLLWLSTNAQGGTIQSVSRQIAQQSYDFTVSNFDAQVEMIHKRREIAEKMDDNADDLREITDKSLGDTRNLISLNEQILSTLDLQLEALGGSSSTSSAVLQVQQARSGVLSALSGLRSGLRSAEFQASDDEPGADASDLQKDVAIKGLDLEEKSLTLNKELARLNLIISQITESLMYPAAPCNGVVERVYVKPGEAVGPGTPIASIKCDKNATTAIVAVSSAIAKSVSRIEKSTASIGSEMITLTPRYITQEPTEGSLHAIIFDIPEEQATKLSDGASLTINVPVGAAKTTSIVPFVPLDAVYQTNTDAYLYVATTEGEKMVAHSKPITLGSVMGSFVEVTDGLTEADQVIVDRNVLEGDVVSIVQ